MRARCVAMRMSLLIVAASALRPATLPLPMRPDPSLSVEDVCEACIGGMREPNSPHLDAGYERLFNFMNYACRKAVTARQGADSLANFTKYGEVSPVIRPLAQAAEVSWSETTLIAGTPTRGTMASLAVDLVLDSGFRHPTSGYERRDDDPGEAEVLRFLIRLQQERRPPLSGCWLITELLDARYAFAGDMGNDSIAN